MGKTSCDAMGEEPDKLPNSNVSDGQNLNNLEDNILNTLINRRKLDKYRDLKPQEVIIPEVVTSSEYGISAVEHLKPIVHPKPSYPPQVIEPSVQKKTGLTSYLPQVFFKTRRQCSVQDNTLISYIDSVYHSVTDIIPHDLAALETGSVTFGTKYAEAIKYLSDAYNGRFDESQVKKLNQQAQLVFDKMNGAIHSGRVNCLANSDKQLGEAKVCMASLIRVFYEVSGQVNQ